MGGGVQVDAGPCRFFIFCQSRRLRKVDLHAFSWIASVLRLESSGRPRKVELHAFSSISLVLKLESSGWVGGGYK